MPATARICPVDGCIATIPPSCEPSAVTAARCSRGETVVRTAGAGRGATDASTRGPGPAPASSSPRGSSQTVIERSLEAAHADDRVRRHPFGFKRLASRGRDRADRSRAPRSPLPKRRAAILPGGRSLRGAALGAARTLPSRASSVARRGSPVCRLSSSPSRRPGKASERDHATRAVLLRPH